MTHKVSMKVFPYQQDTSTAIVFDISSNRLSLIAFSDLICTCILIVDHSTNLSHLVILTAHSNSFFTP